MVTLKDILDRGNNGQYSFIEGLKHEGSKEMLKFYEAELRKKLGETSSSHWDVALTIANLVRSGAWTAYYRPTMELQRLWDVSYPEKKHTENPYRSPGGMDYATTSASLLTFLKINFGLCRTTVYNYLEVVDRFATYITDKEAEPTYSVNAEAKLFQFWQLIEMTSLTYEERKKIEPNWTRAEIREYKKQLREQYKVDKVQPAEQTVEAEEVPLTEAQERFKKFTRNDLINTVTELEERNVALQKEKDALNKRLLLLEQSSANSSFFDKKNRTDSKRKIAALVETFIKGFDYEITLLGRKQGAKAFAGNVAESIITRYVDGKVPESAETSKTRQEVKCEQIPMIN